MVFVELVTSTLFISIFYLALLETGTRISTRDLSVLRTPMLKWLISSGFTQNTGKYSLGSRLSDIEPSEGRVLMPITDYFEVMDILKFFWEGIITYFWAFFYCPSY